MSSVVGIRFQNNSKIYYFSSGDLEVRIGDMVVVESELGLGLGSVVRGRFEPEKPETEFKPVLRVAAEDDIKRGRENEEMKEEARRFFNERIMARGLPMKLLGTEVTLDRKRLIFYFGSENRIDFRELVKDLASKFRTRIELRQVGVRDAARIAGGIGVCGREFCCKSFLQSFAPISIKMAKQQGLVLNTSKLSGHCGRLLCCLNYEYDENAPRERRAEGARRKAGIREEEVPQETLEEVALVIESGGPAVEYPTLPEGSDAEPQKAPSPQTETEKSQVRVRRSRRDRRRKRKGNNGAEPQQGGQTEPARAAKAPPAQPAQGGAHGAQLKEAQHRDKAGAGGEEARTGRRRRRRRFRKPKPQQ